VEQHHKAGGYCTSFKRKGFLFNATTHYIGSLRRKGVLRQIYEELGLHTKVDIARFDPSDVVYCPDYKIHIRSDFNHTISELQGIFHAEADSINAFFKFIRNAELITLYAKLRKKTFSDLLDEYFDDHSLKSVLGVFLGNIGVPPSEASALSSVILFREFVMDGGYYPVGGMQKFPDAFVERFREFGGKIMFGRRVEKIIVRDRSVTGIVTDDGDFSAADTVVSNGDAIHTFYHLVGREHLPQDFTRKIDRLEISPSAFIVYLGIDRNYDALLSNRCSWWCYLDKDFDAEKLFSDLYRGNKPYSDDFIFCVFPSAHDKSLAPPGGEIIYLVVPAGVSESFNWQDKKYEVADELMKRAETYIPGVSRCVSVMETATPLTMQRYTLNSNGASYGWRSTVSQVEPDTMPGTGVIKGLYLAGHWVTQGTGQGGISTVSLAGKRSAEHILKQVTADSPKTYLIQ